MTAKNRGGGGGRQRPRQRPKRGAADGNGRHKERGRPRPGRGNAGGVARGDDRDGGDAGAGGGGEDGRRRRRTAVLASAAVAVAVAVAAAVLVGPRDGNPRVPPPSRSASSSSPSSPPGDPADRLVASLRRLVRELAGDDGPDGRGTSPYAFSWIRHVGLPVDAGRADGGGEEGGFATDDDGDDGGGGAVSSEFPPPRRSGRASSAAAADDDLGETSIDALVDECSRPAFSSVKTPDLLFLDRCLGGVVDLVRRPPPLAAADSFALEAARAEKDGGVSSDEGEMMRRHLSGVGRRDGDRADEAVGVAVIGAGPAGLALASVLAGLGGYNVVVFERRASEAPLPGGGEDDGGKDATVLVRDPYERDWITEVGSSLLCGPSGKGDDKASARGAPPSALDRRSCRLLRALHAPMKEGTGGHNDPDDRYRVVSPLNVLETLLLLTARRRGAALALGDYRDRLDALAAVPNLVVFDATGHRLEGDVDDRRFAAGPEGAVAVDNVPASPGEVRHARERHRVRRSDVDRLAAAGKTPRYARRPMAGGENSAGDDEGASLLYPVRPGPDGIESAYAIHYLKVSAFALTPQTWPKLMQLQKLRAGRGSSPPCAGGDGARLLSDPHTNWCGPVFLYESSTQLRPDAARLVAGVHPGFALRSAIAAASPSQAAALRGLLPGTGRALSELDPADLRRTANEGADAGGGGAAFEVLATLAEEARAAGTGARGEASVFAYRPYLYSDPVAGSGHPVRAALESRGRPDVRVLRIGDSLLSGDVNAATGLVEHLRMVRNLARDLARQKQRATTAIIR
ncbi:hypothetical protein ACHAWF_010134 [Thalassiosira exigua]